MTIKLKEYLALHPDEGVELLTEYGYYTLTSKDICARLRRGGEVRSVTGRPIAFAALLEQEGHVNGALKTTKKLLEAVPPSSTGTLPGVSASEADKVGRNDLIKSRALK